MLFFSYNHIAGQNIARNPNALPTDELNGYSHRYLGNMMYSANDIQDLRFYCQSTGHGRIIDFKTSNANIKTMVVTGNAAVNALGNWNSGFTPLPGHTGILPAAADSVLAGPSDVLSDFPFFKSAANHWGVGGLGNRWECDDYPNDQSLGTRHNIWVRMVV